MNKIAFSIACLFLLCGVEVFAQDKLVFNDEEIVECKVVEITPDLIKYTKFSMPDGPLYTVYKKDVNSIVFENGEIELISPVMIKDKSETFRNSKWDDSPLYRSSFGIDLLAPAFQEMRMWFEHRNAKNTIGHTLTATGFWDNYGSTYYYYDDFIDGEFYYTYPYGGGLILGYMPKIYFIQHRIARPYFAPEANLGFQVSDYTGGVFQATARFGVTITPTPKLNIDFNFGGGGYVIFDGFSNYGTGNMRAGLSIGMNYGKGRKAIPAE